MTRYVGGVLALPGYDRWKTTEPDYERDAGEGLCAWDDCPSLAAFRALDSGLYCAAHADAANDLVIADERYSDWKEDDRE